MRSSKEKYVNGPEFQTAIRKNADWIRGGSMLCIDPGSRHIGYARYQSGELVEAGKLMARGRSGINSVSSRCKDIGRQLREKFPEEVDLLVVERIGIWNDRTVPHLYLQLLQGRGAILANIPFKYCLDIYPDTYKGTVPLKSDALDAVSMGVYLINKATSNG